MKNIYVMFSHTGTNFSKVLKIYTGREYTHVSISMDKEMKKLYSFGRTSTKENPMSARFVKEDIYRGVYKELAYRARCCI